MVDQPRDRLGRFLSPDKSKSHLGFHSKFGGSLGDFLEAAEKAGHTIGIKSGYRSIARQKELFAAAVAKYGSKKAARQWVAPPGKSKHNLGIAADLTYATPEAEAWAHKHAKEFGLNFRMAHEPWHIEPIGALSKMGLGLGALLAPKPNPALPEVMTPPQTRQQALFAPPARPQTINPPSRLAPAPVGAVSRAPLGAIPAALTPAPVGRVERAPLGPVGQFSTPARSLAHPVSAPKPSPLAAAPVGKVQRGPALAPAAPSASTAKLADAYGQYAQSRVAADETARLASQYAQYQRMPAAPPVAAQPLAHPVSVPAPVAPPALATPPAAVLAPALAPPRTVKDYPVAEYQAPPQAPRATAYDVYNGLADTALDNTGQNTVGRLPDGTTTVTNKYGVTTGMTPYGKQTAVGSLPGITGPVAKTAAKVGIPAAASMALGPIGGLLGALAVGALSKPGGLLGGPGLRTIDSVMGPIQAYAVDRSKGQFPGAPSGGYGSGGRMGASFSNRSAEGMRGISPGAANAIGKGLGGLY